MNSSDVFFFTYFYSVLLVLLQKCVPNFPHSNSNFSFLRSSLDSRILSENTEGDHDEGNSSLKTSFILFPCVTDGTSSVRKWTSLSHIWIYATLTEQGENKQTDTHVNTYVC